MVRPPPLQIQGRKSVTGWSPRKCVVVTSDFSEESVRSLETARGFVADLTNLHVDLFFGAPQSGPKIRRFWPSAENA